jgi:hypothetical protein
VLGRPAQPYQTGTEEEPAFFVPLHQAMRLERSSQAVGRRPGHSGGQAEFLEGQWTRFQGLEDEYRLVHNADTAYTRSHDPRFYLRM